MMKKNNKGFTLAELLAVIIIIGLIMAITSTSVIGTMKKARAAMKESQMNSLLDAGKEYINDVIDDNASLTPQVAEGSETNSYKGYDFLTYIGTCDYTVAANAKYCIKGETDAGTTTITRVVYFDSSALKDYIELDNYNISDSNNLCKLKAEVKVELNKHGYYQLLDIKVVPRTGITANRCVK